MITDSELKANLSSNIRALLDERGISVYRLARMVEEPQNTVYRIVRGENVPNAVLLSRIAEAFSASIDDLLKKPVN